MNGGRWAALVAIVRPIALAFVAANLVAGNGQTAGIGVLVFAFTFAPEAVESLTCVAVRCECLEDREAQS